MSTTLLFTSISNDVLSLTSTKAKATSLVSSQSSIPTSTAGLDACVLNCVGSAATSAGCDGITDLNCICTSEAFQSASLQCLQSTCTQEEVAAAAALQSQECGTLSPTSASSTSNANTTTSFTTSREVTVTGIAGSISSPSTSTPSGANTQHETVVAESDRSKSKTETTIILASTISVFSLAIGILVLYWKRRYLTKKFMRRRPIKNRSTSPAFDGAARVSSDFHTGPILSQENREVHGLLSDAATCRDEPIDALSRSTPIEEISIRPTTRETGASHKFHRSRQTNPSKWATGQDARLPRRDETSEMQTPSVATEDNSTEPENAATDPVLKELRKIRSQMARLQMRMEEMGEHRPSDTESLPMYDQVASSREIY